MNLRRHRVLLVGSICAAIIAGLALLAPSLFAESDEKPGTAPETAQQAAEAYPVPDGGADALQDFISDMAGRRPKGESRDEMLADYFLIQGAILEAADKLLSEDIDANTRNAAFMHKLKAYSILAQVGDESAAKKLALETSEMRQLIANAPRDRDNFRLAVNLAQALEQSGNTELAGETYVEFGDAFANSDDEEVAAYAEMLKATGRRLSLVGNPIEVWGTKVDGAPLDWSQYEGKVVLIDFWATWCGPCINELPNVVENYEKYHDRGFDVVGISVDENKSDVEEFLAERRLPWETIFDNDAKGSETNPPLSQYYGVSSIPTVILVGKDGNVVDLGARGERLGELLAEQLGPVEEEAAGQ